MSERAIVFDDWETVLRTEIAPELCRPCREAIVKFRYWLRQTGTAPVPETFKADLDWEASRLPLEKVTICLLTIGVGIWDVRERLGHADSSSTQIYLHRARHTGVGIRSPFDTL